MTDGRRQTVGARPSDNGQLGPPNPFPSVGSAGLNGHLLDPHLGEDRLPTPTPSDKPGGPEVRRSTEGSQTYRMTLDKGVDRVSCLSLPNETPNPSH